jgi:hypothetical protein
MKKQEYMVLCEDGGKNYDVAMFKIYKKESKTIRGSFHYHQKLNRKDYKKFVDKNKDNDIYLYIDNALIVNPLEDIDKRARTLKYSVVLRDALREVKSWLSMLDKVNIIGKEDISNAVSYALGRVKLTNKKRY